MNGSPNDGSAGPYEECEEIARLLPAPADFDIPCERYLQHKELLMRHIDRDRAAGTPPPPPRPTRRLLRPVALAPVTALALTCVVTAGITLDDADRRPAVAASSDAAADMRPVAALLGQISAAAAGRGPLTVRDDQFSYVMEKVREVDLSSGKAVVGPLHDYELWLSQEPGPVRTQGLIRTDGDTAPLHAELGDTDGTPAGLSRPTYQWLASLPTDPDALLDHLYAKVPLAEDRERDQAVFEQIGDLLDCVMPPRTAAALYRAAAKISGVTAAPAAEDALGRRGLGIARTDRTNGVVTEWVFNKRDFAFLGYSTRLTRDTPYGRAGGLLHSSAVVKSAVVDRAGGLPQGENG
ncbi:CU044_5270 family protein [Streptomyces sp. NPDC004250]|uniref:CU044_5270 family protein n=1 Tax=Streptomyces sp. NPDC004250 TaxID=3364692 RepID=UPI00368F3C78